MKMSPIKKIVIGLAVITVALSLITANNMASVMLIVASRNAQENQATQTQTVVQTAQPNVGASQGSTATNSGSTATNSGATDNTAANNTAANNTTDTGSSSTDAPASSEGDTPAAAGMSDKELVDMYKKAVNAARTKSASVVRVKDGAINYNGIVEAGGLSSIASSLMGMFMAADEASIEVKNEPWEKEKLPDASALTLNEIQKISYEESGNNYVVTVVAKNATNPVAGADGVGAIAGVIEEGQITGAIGSVPGLALNNINIAYENVTAVATIDKATGNLVALNLNAPCVLGLDAKMGFISIDGAKVGIQVITEYTVAY